MTIQEAIKSGKPFKREIWFSNSFIIIDNTNVLVDVIDGEATIFEDEDILATDWEVKE